MTASGECLRIGAGLIMSFVFSALYRHSCRFAEKNEKDRAFSTLKVYLAGITACHVSFNGHTVSIQDLCCSQLVFTSVLCSFLQPGRECRGIW